MALSGKRQKHHLASRLQARGQRSRLDTAERRPGRHFVLDGSERRRARSGSILIRNHQRGSLPYIASVGERPVILRNTCCARFCPSPHLIDLRETSSPFRLRYGALEILCLLGDRHGVRWGRARSVRSARLTSADPDVASSRESGRPQPLVGTTSRPSSATK